MPLWANVRAALCLFVWDADRVTVVLHQEHARRPPQAAKFSASWVSPSLVAPSPIITNAAVVLALERRARVRESHRMTGIRRERRALRRDPKLVRVVAQMPIPAKKSQRGDRINAARHDCDAVAIGRKQPIPLLQCANGSDLARLLPAEDG